MWFTFSPGIVRKFQRITARMPDIGNQKVTGIDHIPIGPYNSYLLRHSLHSRQIKGSVKSLGRWSRAVKRMIRQYQRKRHLRVALFCVLHCAGGQSVKPPIMPHKKLVTPYSTICCSTASNSFGKTAASASLWPIKKQLEIRSPDFCDISHILSQFLHLGYIPHDKSQIILNYYREVRGGGVLRTQKKQSHGVFMRFVWSVVLPSIPWQTCAAWHHLQFTAC